MEKVYASSYVRDNAASLNQFFRSHFANIPENSGQRVGQ